MACTARAEYSVIHALEKRHPEAYSLCYKDSLVKVVMQYDGFRSSRWVYRNQKEKAYLCDEHGDHVTLGAESGRIFQAKYALWQEYNIWRQFRYAKWSG